MAFFNRYRRYNTTSALVKVNHEDIPDRLKKIINDVQSSKKNVDFCNSLLAGWEKYKSLTSGQYNALVACEERIAKETKTPEMLKGEQDWKLKFDDEKKRIFKICLDYYITTPYFEHIKNCSLKDPNWIPNEKQYTSMCLNSYAIRLVRNRDAEPSFKPGDIVAMRGQSPGHEEDFLYVVMSIGKVGPAKGSRRYTLIEFGTGNQDEMQERLIKRYKK